MKVTKAVIEKYNKEPKNYRIVLNSLNDAPNPISYKIGKQYEVTAYETPYKKVAFVKLLVKKHLGEKDVVAIGLNPKINADYKETKIEHLNRVKNSSEHYIKPGYWSHVITAIKRQLKIEPHAIYMLDIIPYPTKNAKMISKNIDDIKFNLNFIKWFIKYVQVKQIILCPGSFKNLSDSMRDKALKLENYIINLYKYGKIEKLYVGNLNNDGSFSNITRNGIKKYSEVLNKLKNDFENGNKDLSNVSSSKIKLGIKYVAKAFVIYNGKFYDIKSIRFHAKKKSSKK